MSAETAANTGDVQRLDGDLDAADLASLVPPATVEVVTDDREFVIMWIGEVARGEEPETGAEWCVLRGTDRQRSEFVVELRRDGDGEEWGAAFAYGGDPLLVDEARRVECDDCGSSDEVGPVETDRIVGMMCGACRQKWSDYLTTTFTGGRR